MMKKNQTLVSIALTTFNGEKFIKEQISSLLNQTYKELEIVIVDDCSTDKTQKIIDELKKNNPCIISKTNTERIGFIQNFNEAIKLCKGEIIFLCDQDDIWFKNKVEDHVKIYKNSGANWISNEVTLINENKEPAGVYSKKYYKKTNITDIINMIGGKCILGCATSYRAKLLKKILPIESRAPGHDSYIQLAIYPTKRMHIDKTLQFYRIHDKSVTNTKTPSKVKDNMIKSINYVKSLYKNKRLKIWKRFSFFVIYYLKKTKLLFKKQNNE